MTSSRLPPPNSVLKTYSLSNLEPDKWQDTNEGNVASATSPGEGSPGILNGPLDSAAAKMGRGADEPDPLGLFQGGILG